MYSTLLSTACARCSASCACSAPRVAVAAAGHRGRSGLPRGGDRRLRAAALLAQAARGTRAGRVARARPAAAPARVRAARGRVAPRRRRARHRHTPALTKGLSLNLGLSLTRISRAHVLVLLSTRVFAAMLSPSS